MKKENVHKLLYGICILLLVGFAVRLGADYLKYDGMNGSAPFYVFLLQRAVEFLIPCIIAFIGGNIAKKKYSK